MEEQITNELDPQNYFDYIKSKKEKCSDEFLNNAYEVTMHQLRKAMTTGQNHMFRRLHYTLSVIERERILINKGIDVFVLREDIEYYIEQVKNKRIKIVDLEYFPREIPDEIVEKIAMLKEENLFDNYYVVYTDYTGKVTQDVNNMRKAEAIRKDPIVFGTFEQKLEGIYDICDRFYYIGDWEDEYCDLTLTKMVQEMTKAGKPAIVNNLAIPEATPESLRAYVNRLDEVEDARRFRLARPVKQSFLQKVKTAWKALVS